MSSLQITTGFKNSTIKFFFFIVVCFSSLSVYSGSYKFEHLSKESGLSGNNIKTTYVDCYGYVWVGTFGGIDRFDGLEVKNFNALFDDGFKVVTSFAEDAENRLWICTEDGIYYWDRISTKFTKLAFSSEQKPCFTKIQYYENNVLFISSEQGFYSANTQTLELDSIQFHKDTEHPLNYISDFIIEEDQIYLATKAGLIQFDIPLNRSLIYRNSKEGSQSFTSVAKYKNDVYLSLGSKGLVEYSLKDGSFSNITALQDYKIASLHVHDSTLLIGTNSQGIKTVDLSASFADRTLENKYDFSAIESNTVYSISVDNNQTIWLGTYVHGLYFSQLKNGFFNTYTGSDNALSNKSIRSFYFNNETNQKLIGTRNGLFVLDGSDNSKHFITKNSSLGADIILRICPYKEGALIGTYGGGIGYYSFETNQLSVWNDAVFKDQTIYAIENDTKGNVWFGGFKGIYKVSGDGNIQSFNKGNSVYDDYLVFSIRIDKYNRIWVGNRNGATVYEYRNNDFKLLDYIGLAESARVVDFYTDSSDNMWICTIKNGVYKVDMDFNIEKNITVTDGLCNNSVTSVIEAEDSKFWFSTINGLTLYDSHKDSCQNFVDSYGLLGSNFCRGAAFKDLDNTIWLGNEKGLVYFNASNSLVEDTDPDILITDILVGGNPISKELQAVLDKPIEDIESLSLPSKYNSIGFNFTNISNRFNHDDQFMVQLEGVDKGWVKLEGTNKVYYNALKPGKYKFSVGVSNGSNIAKISSLKSVNVIIKHAWYFFVGWFVFVVLILLVCVQWILYNKRRAKLKETVSTKSKVSNNLKYETSNLNRETSKVLLEKIQSHIETSQIYLKQEVKIGHVADIFGVSINEVSQAINQNLNLGFTDFINTYRIEECKLRMRSAEYEKYTLLGIAESCGFNSKSSFNRAFKKVTGLTPTQYLNQ